MREIFSAMALSAAAMVGLGCSCTEVGCDDGVTVHLSGILAVISAGSHTPPMTVRACVDSECRDVTVTVMNGQGQCVPAGGPADCIFDADGVLDVSVYGQVEGQTTVSVEVKDSAGQSFFMDSQQVDLQSFQPNGAMCEPTCHQGNASFTIPVK